MISFNMNGQYNMEDLPPGPPGSSSDVLIYDPSALTRDLPTRPLWAQEDQQWTSRASPARKEWWVDLEGFNGRANLPGEAFPPLGTFRAGGQLRCPNWGDMLRRLRPDLWKIKQDKYMERYAHLAKEPWLDFAPPDISALRDAPPVAGGQWILYMKQQGINMQALDTAQKFLERHTATGNMELIGVLFHLEKQERDWKHEDGASKWIKRALDTRWDHAEDPWPWEGPLQWYPMS